MPPVSARAAIALAAACAAAACGHAPAPPKAETTRRPSACSLINRAEMSQILSAPIGKLMAEDSDAKTSCAYPPGEAGSWAQADVAIEWKYAGGRTFEKQMTDAFGGSAVGRQVAHAVSLGDDASYSREGVLSIRQGTALITITLPMRGDSEAKATAIGKTVLQRLGASIPAAARQPVSTSRRTKPRRSRRRRSSDEDAALKSLADATPPFPDGFEPGGECPDPGPSADADITADAAATIPLEEGLTLANIWTNHREDYDHECLTQVTKVDRGAIAFTVSCPQGEDRHMQSWSRRICRADLRDSYMYETAGSRKFPDTLRGTLSFALSVKSFSDLTTTGHARHRWLELAALRDDGRPLHLVDDDDGSVARQGKRTFKVIVNDRPVDLPVVEAAGSYKWRGQDDEFTLLVLDDARFPLMLDYHHSASKFFITYTKISFPTAGEMEKHLAVDKHVDVYGIYFDFASDRLRPESGPVLREISDALTKNPAWTLTINGHTDNVGGDAFNLDLSRRRSLSVRRALSETYHIDPARLQTAGFGASQPKESNATIDGRAKNRRVELVRQ